MNKTFLSTNIIMIAIVRIEAEIKSSFLEFQFY